MEIFYKFIALVVLLWGTAQGMSMPIKQPFFKDSRITSIITVNKTDKSTECRKMVESILNKEYEVTRNKGNGQPGAGRIFLKNRGLKLDLSHKGLFFIDGIDMLPYKLTSVTVLDASHNALKSIKVSILRTILPNLRRLNVSHNQINTVQCSGVLSVKGDYFPPKQEVEKAWSSWEMWWKRGMPLCSDEVGRSTSRVLEYIDFSHNEIENFDPQWIPYYNAYIDLSYNKLSVQQQDALVKVLRERILNNDNWKTKYFYFFLYNDEARRKMYTQGHFDWLVMEYLNCWNNNESSGECRAALSTVELDQQ